MNTEEIMVKMGSIDIPENYPGGKHTPAELRRLKSSIKDNGILVMILVRPMPDNRFELIDGFARLAVARELGWPDDTEVPAMAVDIEDMIRQN